MSCRVRAMASRRSLSWASSVSSRSRTARYSSTANGFAAPSSWKRRRSVASRPGDGSSPAAGSAGPARGELVERGLEEAASRACLRRRRSDRRSPRHRRRPRRRVVRRRRASASARRLAASSSSAALCGVLVVGGHLDPRGLGQVAQADLAKPGELDQQLLAQPVEPQPRLHRRDLGATSAIVGGAQPLTGRRRGTLGLGEPRPLGAIVGEQRPRAWRVRQLPARSPPRARPRPRPARRRRLARGRRAPRGRGPRSRCDPPRAPRRPRPARGDPRRRGGSAPASRPRPRGRPGDRGARRPATPRRRSPAARRPGRRHGAASPEDGDVEHRQGGRRPLGVGGEALGLGQVPCRLACRGLERTTGGPLRVLGALRRSEAAADSAARARSSAARVPVAAAVERVVSASAASASAWRASASRASRSASARRSSGESPRPIRTVNGSTTASPSRRTASHPSGSAGWMRERRVEIGHPDDAREQRPGRAGRVAADGIREPSAGRGRERVVEAPQLAPRSRRRARGPRRRCAPGRRRARARTRATRAPPCSTR